MVSQNAWSGQKRRGSLMARGARPVGDGVAGTEHPDRPRLRLTPQAGPRGKVASRIWRSAAGGPRARYGGAQSRGMAPWHAG